MSRQGSGDPDPAPISLVLAGPCGTIPRTATLPNRGPLCLIAPDRAICAPGGRPRRSRRRFVIAFLGDGQYNPSGGYDARETGALSPFQHQGRTLH